MFVDMNLNFLQPSMGIIRPFICRAQESPDKNPDRFSVDNELARRAQKGDLSAFEELFNRHNKRIYNIALRMLQDESDAADATQETFVRVYKSIDKLADGEAFVSWLKTVAINICRDALRKRSKVKTESLDAPIEYDDGGSASKEIADWSNDPGEKTLTKSLQDTVQRAIYSLKREYREVVTLFYIDGANIAEISKITGSPEGTVKSRLSRARAELKRKLESYISDE